MTSEKFKKQRRLRPWDAETTFLLIRDVYKDVTEVKLVSEITFNSAILRQPSVKAWKRTLIPTDRLHRKHPMRKIRLPHDAGSSSCFWPH